MEKRPFADKSTKPDAALLKKTLGKTYAQYEKLEKLASAFRKEWNFSAAGGWMQKISDGKKALCYIIPLEKSWIMSLTVREKERDVLLKDKALADISGMLKNARKFSEGFALRFVITGTENQAVGLALISKIIELRK